MSRAVVIGGLSNSQVSVDRVGKALSGYYSEVETLTFPYAMENPREVAKIVDNATVITQSAGMLALYGASARQLHAFAAPVPRSRSTLFSGAAQKTIQMFLGNQPEILPSYKEAVKFNAQSIGELVIHGTGRLKYLLNGAISSFNAITVGGLLAEKYNTDVRLIHGEHDLFCRPTLEQKAQAEQKNIAMVTLPGAIHDQLIIDPEGTLDTYFYEHYSSRPEALLSSISTR